MKNTGPIPSSGYPWFCPRFAGQTGTSNGATEERSTRPHMYFVLYRSQNEEITMFLVQQDQKTASCHIQTSRGFYFCGWMTDCNLSSMYIEVSHHTGGFYFQHPARCGSQFPAHFPLYRHPDDAVDF